MWLAATSLTCRRAFCDGAQRSDHKRGDNIKSTIEHWLTVSVKTLFHFLHCHLLAAVSALVRAAPPLSCEKLDLWIVTRSFHEHGHKRRPHRLDRLSTALLQIVTGGWPVDTAAALTARARCAASGYSCCGTVYQAAFQPTGCQFCIFNNSQW